MSATPQRSIDSPPKQYRDDVARVFDRMNVQYGVSFDFPVGIRRDDRMEFAWEWFSHVEYDGIATMAALAKRLGHTLETPKLRIRADRDATAFDYLRPFLRRSYLRAAPRSPWDRTDRREVVSTERRIPQHLIPLSKAESETVGAVARRLGVSVNSLVLWSLSEAVRGIAVRAGDRQHWTIPVNMRGGVGIDDTAANPISFIRVPIRAGDTPQVLHARLYDLLETGMHYVMLRWIRFFANRSRMKFPPVRSTGTFSNIGNYVVPGVDRVAICPPTGPTEPIATSIVTWNGLTTLALSVHHTMNPPQREIDAVGHRWRTAILTGEVTSAPALLSARSPA